MLSSLLVLAEAATTDAEHGVLWNTVSKIAGDFGVTWPYLIAQIVSFSIVATLLWKFAFKPVVATLDERQRKIEAGLKYSDEMQAKLAAAQQESAGIIKHAQVDATRIIDEARKTAKDFLDKQMQEATAKAADTFAKAQQGIELEHRKMLADARHEIARLVVTTTERVLAKKLTDADRASYNDAATRELTNV
jgi:F-type H+-transporting ATPase subunit b